MKNSEHAATRDDVYAIALGAVMSYCRSRSGMTQKRLAQLMEVSPAIVSRWEQGGASPRQHHLRRYAERVGLSASDLIDTADAAMDRASRLLTLLRPKPEGRVEPAPWWTDAIAEFGEIGLRGLILVAIGERMRLLEGLEECAAEHNADAAVWSVCDGDGLDQEDDGGDLPADKP